jgi:SAM-dependent methyltransferase
MSAAVRAPCEIESSTIFGDVIALAASYTPARVTSAAIERLDLRRDDVALELGCGSGRLLAQVAARAHRGFVSGIDPSPLMVRHARFRNRRLIERGRAEIEVGATTDLSRFERGRFQKVYGLHVVYFWEKPERDLAEIRRVLAPGGRLLLAFCPAELAPDGRDRARCSIESVETWLERAGFGAIEGASEWDGERPLAWIAARRAGAE